jgi:hypothetical protein
MILLALAHEWAADDGIQIRAGGCDKTQKLVILITESGRRSGKSGRSGRSGRVDRVDGVEIQRYCRLQEQAGWSGMNVRMRSRKPAMGTDCGGDDGDHGSIFTSTILMCGCCETKCVSADKADSAIALLSVHDSSLRVERAMARQMPGRERQRVHDNAGFDTLFTRLRRGVGVCAVLFSVGFFVPFAEGYINQPVDEDAQML